MSLRSSIWSFEANGLTIAVEESIFLAASDGRRRSEQLVVAFDAVATPQVSWRFTRISTANPRAGKTVAAAIARLARQSGSGVHIHENDAIRALAD